MTNRNREAVKNHRHKGLARFLTFLILFSALSPALVSPHAHASELAPVLEGINKRNTSWLAFKANVSLKFFVSDKKRAACSGELFYQRLDEKIYLECKNGNEKIVFILKTADRQFELYVPDREKIFRGNIFALEDGTHIQSHLKPLDFYRALKPGIFSSERTSLASENEDGWSLDVFGSYFGRSYLARQADVSSQGDIVSETYYTVKQEPSLEIKRGDFKAIEAMVFGKIKEIRFPHEVIMYSQADEAETTVTFSDVTALTSVSEEQWLFPYPPETEVVTFSNFVQRMITE